MTELKQYANKISIKFENGKGYRSKQLSTVALL